MKLTRMWINQPSTLQTFHCYHGKNVLAHHERDGVWVVYFLDGDVVAQEMPGHCLSHGWR